MATSDIVQRVKTILYGYGLGEAPAIILAASDANEQNIGTTVTFDLATADADDPGPGDVLGVVGAATADDAYLMYVLSRPDSTSVTALASFQGAPAVSTAGDLDGAVLEVAPFRSEWAIYQAIETIFATMLWPDVYRYNTYTVTPDLQDYQVELNANVEEIEDAFQIIAGERFSIPFGMQKNVPTAVSSTTVLGELWAIDNSSVYVVTRERYVESSTLSEALVQCIATGAAAILLGASRNSANLHQSEQDRTIRTSYNPANDLWRDFITMRSSLTEDLAREVDWFEIRRG